jgi:hypothetical protein
MWCALFLGVVACATFVPQQGWNESFGPVVPHDNFPADCSLCHTGSDWHTLRADFKFDHEQRTGVALVGAHTKASCLLCHNDRGPVKQFAAQGCSGCHEDPHQTRLGRNCSDCHNENTWQPREAIALHDRTRFPLVGAHAAVACFRCHAGAQVGNFAGATAECSSCHQADRARTTNPNHTLLGYSQACEQCHVPLGWQPARFDHPGTFPLTNGHAGRACAECHSTPNSFNGQSTACVSCHNDDYATSTTPSHAAAGFSTDCLQCHDTRTFSNSRWSHPSSFALTFGHAGRDCMACHTGQVYAGTPTACNGCHMANYQATQSPNHVAGGYPTDCTGCHNTSAWRGAGQGHPASFPLTNSHSIACNACHTTPGIFTGQSTDCVSCHLTNYQGAQNPNHVAGGYPTDCTGCHNTSSWHGAGIGHPSSFPLTNAHARACTDCHTTPGIYTGQNPACVSCHLPDYQGTTNPPHVSFGMSQTCQDCHGTTVWSNGTFQHNFPITSGAHRNIPCFDCHNNASNRTAFSCIDCHEHRQSSMNSKHSGVNNYAWVSARCYQCHPNGRH